MAGNTSPDYKTLFLQEEERRKQAEERQRQAEERQKHAEDEGRLRERSQRTTFVEFMQYCHDEISRMLKSEIPSKSTTGKIPLPVGKYCPTRLEPWTDCQAQQQELYSSVYSYLQPASGDAPRLFPPRIALEDLGRRINRQPMSGEQDLEAYERQGVEDHVRDIITELCKLPAARDEFGLGDGIWFNNHKNSLDEVAAPEMDASQLSSVPDPKPDQFCIHRVDGNTTTLLTTVEYKPPQKLPEESLRLGLRPMDLWKEMVKSNKIPTDREAKLRYGAERLVSPLLFRNIM